VRILFDGYWWSAGPASNRQVMKDLVLAWQTEFPDDDIFIAVRAKHFHDVRHTVPDNVSLVKTHLWPQAFSNLIELTRAASRLEADLTLAHNFAALGKGSLVFVHDVLFLSNPEWFSRPERLYFGLMAPLSRHAKAIFTSSKNEAERIRSKLNPDAAVHEVGLAVGSELSRATPERPDRLRLSANNFVLTVGRLNVRKNLETTIKAAVESGEISSTRPLVVVGEKSGLATADSAIDSAWLRDGLVVLAGFVSMSELVWLYENCSLFVYLTLDEGFGLPPLEALHFGAPVLVSDIPVMREVVGPLGQFVDPRSETAVADAFRSHAASRTLGIQPRAASRDYSWAASVRRIRELGTVPGETATS
jgi:glycosyltransferase involved in cell wall biosynthesis